MGDWLRDEVRKSMSAMGRGAWLDTIEDRIDSGLKDFGLEPVEQIEGGKNGIVILCERRGEKIIFKAIHDEEIEGQSHALEKLSGPFPRLLEKDLDQGFMLLEYIEGEELEMDEPVALCRASELIGIIHDTELDYYTDQAPGFLADCLRSNVVPPDGLNEHIELARKLAAEAPEFEQKQIHADLGVHNLYQGKNGILYALDPSGMAGPIELDAGSLAVWSGRPKKDSDRNIPVISEALGLDEREVARWTTYRLIIACNRFWVRGEYEKYEDALESLPRLYATYGF